MIQIQISNLLHNNGIICDQMWYLFGFNRNMIGLMSGMEATILAAENVAVDEMVKGTPAQKVTVIIIITMIQRIHFTKIKAKSKC